jgi:hypothetical protein
MLFWLSGCLFMLATGGPGIKAVGGLMLLSTALAYLFDGRPVKLVEGGVEIGGLIPVRVRYDEILDIELDQWKDDRSALLRLVSDPPMLKPHVKIKLAKKRILPSMGQVPLPSYSDEVRIHLGSDELQSFIADLQRRRKDSQD